MKLSGVIPPLLTPLTDEGELDETSLRSLIDFQLSAEVSGVFVLGSSGEAIYLTLPCTRNETEFSAATSD